MNRRLAQIIAASVGPDGKPNRAKIYDELSLSPDAPEVILIDAFFAADESFRALKDEQTKGLAGFKTVLDSELQQLVRAFAAHKLALADAKTELATAFMLQQEKLNASAKEIMDHSKASAAAAQKAAQAAEAQAAASTAAVDKVTQAANEVALAHATAEREATASHEKLQALTQNLAEREQIWLLIVVLFFGVGIGCMVEHLWIEPRMAPAAAESSR